MYYKCCDNKGYRNISKIMDKVEIIFDSVEVVQRDNVYLYIINDLSDKLKNYIRENFVFISTGDIELNYKAVIEDFIQRITKSSKKDKKDDKHLKGIVGELLTHIFIRNPKYFLF